MGGSEKAGLRGLAGGEPMKEVKGLRESNESLRQFFYWLRSELLNFASFFFLIFLINYRY